MLGLWLVAEGGALRAVQPDGRRLLTHEESEAAHQRAEEELARLCAMLEQDREGRIEVLLTHRRPVSHMVLVRWAWRSQT